MTAATVIQLADRAPKATSSSPSGGAVLSFASAVETEARRAVALVRFATDRRDGWDAEAAQRKAAAAEAQTSATRMLRRMGTGELHAAMARRAFLMGLASADVSKERRRATLDLHAAERAAGAALSRLPRPDARRIYAAAFPGLTPQRVGTVVSALLREHKAALRHTREAV